MRAGVGVDHEGGSWAEVGLGAGVGFGFGFGFGFAIRVGDGTTSAARWVFSLLGVTGVMSLRTKRLPETSGMYVCWSSSLGELYTLRKGENATQPTALWPRYTRKTL